MKLNCTFPLKGILVASAIGLSFLFTPGQVQAEQLKEVASFAGVRDNVLVGYGLVVGLDSTGDQTTQTPFTGQSLSNMLSTLGITVPQGANMQLRNVAAVMITAKMAAFSRPGQYIDVVVSSIGNAKTLRGGTLLMAPLKGSDGQIYAMAQGNLITGGAGAGANGNAVTVNQQAGGRIARGAIIEREIPLELGDQSGKLDLYLNSPDFNTAQKVVFAINSEFGRTVASAADAGMIILEGPRSPNARVNFIARVNNVNVTPSKSLPKVVINARTGAVVMNEGVKLYPAAVAQGNLAITIDNDPLVVQPEAFANGETVVVNKTRISLEQEGGGLRTLESAANLADVVMALNSLGASPSDLMSILEALKVAGSLRAEIEVI